MVSIYHFRTLIAVKNGPPWVGSYGGYVTVYPLFEKFEEYKAYEIRSLCQGESHENSSNFPPQKPSQLGK